MKSQGKFNKSVSTSGHNINVLISYHEQVIYIYIYWSKLLRNIDIEYNAILRTFDPFKNITSWMEANYNERQT